MKKFNKYVAAIYASTIIGLGTCAYAGYNIVKDKTFSEKTVDVSELD